MESLSINDLATIIATNTEKISKYLLDNDLPLPSFDVDALNRSLISSNAPEIEAARVAVIDATLMLRDLILGPNLALDVRRIIRHAMTKRIFSEARKGIVTHTAASRVLAEDSQVADWVGANTDELWQAASQTVNAMGFALANGTDKSVFDVLSQDPSRARRFGNAMKAFTEGTGFDMQYVVDNYPWKDIGQGTVVDVGGSHGSACTYLAKTFPGLNFIVQDIPPVVEAAAKNIPSELAERIQFMAHDFLKEQPIKNADVYFFRWIFHNWSDKYCIQILRNHIPALKKGARIVINDNVLPEPGVLPIWREERLRSMDLTMMELQDARERELDDWAKLFEEADKGFRFKGGKKLDRANLWILEAVWEGDSMAG
ncbi:hypothetical protein EAF04_000669 [Stromatinia cepivora]|nr:hypothetical protein EAF04_000669 [Stromatinia cepivora]